MKIELQNGITIEIPFGTILDSLEDADKTNLLGIFMDNDLPMDDVTFIFKSTIERAQAFLNLGRNWTVEEEAFAIETIQTLSEGITKLSIMIQNERINHME